MSSVSDVEFLKKKLLEDARKKAESIVKEAEEKAKNIVREAEERLKRMVEEKRRELLSKAKREAEIIVSEAKRRYRLELVKARYEILSRVYSRAGEVLHKRDFDRELIEKSIENLLNEVLEAIPRNARMKIIVNPSDRGVVKRIVEKMGLTNNVDKIDVDKDLLGGVVVILDDGTIIDNSYNTRLKRAFERYSRKLVEILWTD